VCGPGGGGGGPEVDARTDCVAGSQPSWVGEWVGGRVGGWVGGGPEGTQDGHGCCCCWSYVRVARAGGGGESGCWHWLCKHAWGAGVGA